MTCAHKTGDCDARMRKRKEANWDTQAVCVMCRNKCGAVPASCPNLKAALDRGEWWRWFRGDGNTITTVNMKRGLRHGRDQGRKRLRCSQVTSEFMGCHIDSEDAHDSSDDDDIQSYEVQQMITFEADSDTSDVGDRDHEQPDESGRQDSDDELVPEDGQVRLEISDILMPSACQAGPLLTMTKLLFFKRPMAHIQCADTPSKL